MGSPRIVWRPTPPADVRGEEVSVERVEEECQRSLLEIPPATQAYKNVHYELQVDSCRESSIRSSHVSGVLLERNYSWVGRKSAGSSKWKITATLEKAIFLKHKTFHYKKWTLQLKNRNLFLTRQPCFLSSEYPFNRKRVSGFLEIQNNYDPHPLIRLEKASFLTNLRDLLLQKVNSSSENPKFFPLILAILYFYFRLRSKTLQTGNTLCIDVSQPYGDGSQRKDFTSRVQVELCVQYQVLLYTTLQILHQKAHPTQNGGRLNLHCWEFWKCF